jgi:nicotinamidase/pyrazinamidase
MKNRKALVVVDMQNDFMEGGSLGVKGSHSILPVVNSLLSKFGLVIFTKDWHPSNHKSFASQHEGKDIFDKIDLNGLEQTLWPDHCVQNTIGSDLHSDIDFSKIDGDFYIFKKGTDPEVDSYSGFYDNGRRTSTGLKEFLEDRGISDIFICGLAGDYCCKNTAIDGSFEGFDTYFIMDATGFLGSKDETLMELFQADVKVIDSSDLNIIL